MKKFSYFLTLALVLFFAVSCGDSKKEEKEKPDTDEISDEEPAETDGDAEPAETDGDAEEPADDSDKEPAPEVDPLKCEDFALQFPFGRRIQKFVQKNPFMWSKSFTDSS